MDKKTVFGQVPDSITFGYKILEIPTLEEMGIPMGGYGVCNINDGLSRQRYEPCWIERNDYLLTYNFRFFQHENKPFFSYFNDPWFSQEFEIISPISGLLIHFRKELTVGFTSGLQYEDCEEDILPVLLVPNDEPSPDSANFYVYDRIAQVLRDNFYSIPIRDRQNTTPERLRDYVARKGSDTAKHYNTAQVKLRERNSSKYRKYNIRDISPSDNKLISKIQHLRGTDIRLRDKLVHIARKYGDSI